MPLTEPIDVLLDQNDWALRGVLDACAALPPDDFHRTFPIGCGSLHDSLAHMLSAMRGWSDVMAGRPVRERLDESGETFTIDQLRDLLTEATAELTALAHAHPYDDWVEAERGGRTFSFPRGGMLAHVLTHGMHHRAQCLNMLRHLGVETLPPSSVAEWMILENGVPTA